MGNRCVITTPQRETGVYLHNNGGRDTIEPLLRYCELQGYRPPETDDYGFARLVTVMGNFFGGSLSVGVGAYSDDEHENPGDNGIYVVGDGWKVVGRIYPYEGFEEQDEHDFDGMLRALDASMPEADRLGDFLDSVEVPASELRVGDEVWLCDPYGRRRTMPVAGFGRHRGEGPELPYVERYDHDGDWLWNTNNFIRAERVRIRPRA